MVKQKCLLFIHPRNSFCVFNLQLMLQLRWRRLFSDERILSTNPFLEQVVKDAKFVFSYKLSFQGNCGATSVGKYNKTIWYYQLS